MDVTVIGATGNIGTALLGALSGDPEITRLRAVARRPPHQEWPKTTFLALDVTSDDLGPAVQGADAVVHLAWVFQPTRRPAVTWQVNVGGTSRVLDAVARHGVAVLVCSSSVGAYSPGAGLEVDESWPTDGLPTAAYSREKAYVERMLDAFDARRPDVRVARIRPAFVFQRSSASQQRHLFAGPFVPTALLRPGTLPLIPFPGGLRLQAVHAADVSQAFRLALLHDARGPYNVAADPVVDGDAVAGILGTRALRVPPALVRAALGAAWLTHVSPAAPALFDLAMSLPTMQTGRVRTELGWTPQTSSIGALTETIEGMVEGAGGDTPPLAGRAGHSGRAGTSDASGRRGRRARR